ncbi:MAG: YceD family protein [Propionivibrio sp.]
MSQRIVIDSKAFAREARLLEGKLPVASLDNRVLDLLIDSGGNLQYRVEGLVDSRNKLQVKLWLDGSLSVRCQRCLESIVYPVKIRSLLEFVDDESELTQEDFEDDSKDFLSAQKELDVVALIEDEIILDLPSAPRHESCALPDAELGTGKVSPFSVLQGLRRKA